MANGKYNGWTHNHYNWINLETGAEKDVRLPYYKVRDTAKGMARKGFVPALVVETESKVG